MDFFTSKAPSARGTATHTDGLETPFMQATQNHFPGVSSSLLTTRLSPQLVLQTPMLPSKQSGSWSVKLPNGLAPNSILRRGQSVQSPASYLYTAMTHDQLEAACASAGTLLLDIRPYIQFQVSRVKGAIPVSVPSTLLKRTGFGLDKLLEMLPDDLYKQRLLKWQSASCIIVYDSDSLTLTENSNLLGLLRKFQAVGFSQRLAWVVGGFTIVSSKDPTLVEVGQTSSPLGRSQSTPIAASHLFPANLPMTAFQQASTTAVGRLSVTDSERRHRRHSATLAANPFYDNIRQNVELSQGIVDRIPLNLLPEIIARKDDLPFGWLRTIVTHAESDNKAADLLAMQFYRIEVGEQRRLQGIMDHHSKEVPSHAQSSSPELFPYSITAGIEMGTKNRYRDIWPFEHARVRLQSMKTGQGSDYINASFVQPLISSRRYIATQGPMDSTYADFWALCWEQCVPVVVMLTREVEGSSVKCGNYWKNGRYGPFELLLEEELGTPETSDAVMNTPGFNFPVPQEDPHAEHIVRRVFRLRNVERPDLPARTLVQLQYLGWSDMNVPESPRGLLTLIKQLNEALVFVTTKQSPTQGPVLLHCSAGVGRTGCFVIVDAVLDGIRRELLKRSTRTTLTRESSPNSMDVDEPESVSVPRISLTLADSDALSSTRVDRESIFQPKPPFAVSNGSESSHTTASVDSQDPGSKTPFRELVEQHDAPDPEPSVSAQSKVDAWAFALPSFSSNTELIAMNVPEATVGSLGNYYKQPRKLHQRGSPPMLSSLEEPIREVLEDIREQRMSLCQSLRQYVFVHKAIIEGALDVVDDFRRSLDERKASQSISDPSALAKPLASLMPFSTEPQLHTRRHNSSRHTPSGDTVRAAYASTPPARFSVKGNTSPSKATYEGVTGRQPPTKRKRDPHVEELHGTIIS